MDGFSLGEYDTIAMPDAVLEDSPLNNAFFLPPLLTAHKEFRVEIKECRCACCGMSPFQMTSSHQEAARRQWPDRADTSGRVALDFR